jgi:hypothetical protein
MQFMKPLKYQIPAFLASEITQPKYQKWLSGRAVAQLRRDKKRGNTTATTEAYKLAIHQAVSRCGAYDDYTGELLEWSLLGQYRNAESKAQKRLYKARFALLPSVDHIGDGLSGADFKICAWRTNDAKSDLTHEQFVALCRRVVAHFDRTAAGNE